MVSHLLVQVRLPSPEERSRWKQLLPSWGAVTRDQESVLCAGNPVRMIWVMEGGVVWMWADSEETLHDPALQRALAAACPRPLLLHGWVPAQSPLAGTLPLAGWRVTEEQTLWEMELEKMRLGKVDLLSSRLQDSKKLPSDLCVTPMQPGDESEILTFCLKVMPGSLLPVFDRLRRGGLEGFSTRLSQVLRVDGKIRGVILCTWKGEVAEADLVVVDQGLRGGWANLLLKQSVIEPMRGMGVRLVRYWINPALNADGLRAARLAGAQSVQSLNCWELPADP